MSEGLDVPRETCRIHFHNVWYMYVFMVPSPEEKPQSQTLTTDVCLDVPLWVKGLHCSACKCDSMQQITPRTGLRRPQFEDLA